MHQVFNTLASKFSTNLVFLTIDAEAIPSLSEKFDVAVVPTFVCVSPDNTVFWRHEGACVCVCVCVTFLSIPYRSCFPLPFDGGIKMC